jgi:uncharacterized protein YbgA (DUF1722 family)
MVFNSVDVMGSEIGNISAIRVTPRLKLFNQKILSELAMNGFVTFHRQYQLQWLAYHPNRQQRLPLSK